MSKNRNISDNNKVPSSLRLWFIIHFFIDVAVAIPLIIAPIWTLNLFGWTAIDPVSSRIVGAALLGIGISSFLVRDASKEIYHHLLTLKLIWSGSAIIGLAVSLFQEAPKATILILMIFIFFFMVWAAFKMRLSINEVR